MKEPSFVSHEGGDSCAVAVKEGLQANTTVSCWVMSSDESFEIGLKSDIPIGHKVAIKEIKKGETVIKYGIDIGRCIKDINVGEHLHVHNVKTKRW